MLGNTMLPPPVSRRRFGRVNWLGLWTLVAREVLRFAKIWQQTVLAPVFTSLLFVTVFTFAFASGRPEIGDVPFLSFLVPGIVMMAVIQNAFQNTGSSILHAKILGSLYDTLVAPLSPGELNLGYAMGGIIRGALVAAAISAVLFPLFGLTVANPFWAMYFVLAASSLLASVGILTGMWAEKFDHMATVTNFLIVPLSFLSGTFYSIRYLPEPWETVSRFNPFFYLIDGFRYGVLGVSDADPRIGLAVSLALGAALWATTYWLLRIGFRIKD